MKDIKSVCVASVGRCAAAIERVEEACRVRSWKRLAALCLLIYLVAYYPMVRANFYYKDDIGRALLGYDTWGDTFSRYVSDFLSHLIHVGDFLFDVSPLTQLIAAAFLVLSGLVVISQFRDGKSISVWDAVALVPLGLCPYFLECMSFKYDSPYMALSILASALPVVFRKKHAVMYGGAVVAGTLVMCMTYQAASGIFPMLIVLLCFHEWCRDDSLKDVFAFAGVSAAAYAVGIGIYFLLLMKPVDTYVSNSVASLSTILYHYQVYIGLMQTDFKGGWKVFIGLLAVWFIIAAVMRSRRGRLATAVMAVIVVAAMFLLSFGLYPVLSTPTTSPRGMYGVGAFIAFLGIGNLGTGQEKWVTRGLTLVLAWAFIVFACEYGNALSLQSEWEDFRREEVLQDLTDLEEFYDGEDVTVQIVGTVGYAASISNASVGYNMLTRLVPVTFVQGWVWGNYKIAGYYGATDASWIYSDTVPAFGDWELYSDTVPDYEDWELLHESSYHQIYYEDGYFIVVLK